MGGESELFRKAGAQLYLVDADESVLLQRGEFVLLLVKNSRSPLAAVVAMVGDMQWPVGKDSFVSKLGDAGFSFSNLPARLKFTLSLNKLETAEMQKLERLFEEYSSYVHADSDAIQAADKFWTRLAKNVDAVTGGCVPDALSAGAVSSAQKGGMEYSVSSNLAQRMQQARRMSAVAKLFARSVERGAINASTHVKKVETEVVRKGGSGRTHIDLALACVDAVAKVVEAVETAGKTLLENTQAGGTEWAESKYGHKVGNDVAESLDAVSSMIMSAWTLNKVGLRMFFRTISSINSSASMRGMVSQSASEASGRSSTASDLGSLSSSSSKSPSVSTENNLPQVNATSALARGALSTRTSTFSAGAPLVSTDVTSRGPQPADQPSCLPCRQPSPVLPPRFGDRVAHRPPSLPPRFHGAPVAFDRVGGGVTTTLSLASGGSAGPGPPSLAHVYRPQATQLQPSQTMGMGMPPPPPCPPRPPPRPRPPFHRHP